MVDGQGPLMARRPSVAPSFSTPSGVSRTGWMPKKGREAQRRDHDAARLRLPPAHHVSTMGQLGAAALADDLMVPAPRLGSGLIGSPTEPSSWSDARDDAVTA